LTTTPRRTAQKGRPGIRPRRVPPRQTFVQRNRTRLLWAGVALVTVVAGAFVYLSLSRPVYACTIEWTPPATSSPAPSTTPRLGYLQDEMGREHVPDGTFVKYLFCPPASGKHYATAGITGPIVPKLYGPNEKTVPQNWIHNMEHGALVLLYKCPGDGVACTDSGQAALRQLYDSFPPSPICKKPPGTIGPVITRFDDMKFNYAALVWDEVLPLDKLDVELIKAFFLQRAERTNPEPQCAEPSESPGPTPTEGPSATPTDTTTPSTSPATSGTAPSPSVAPTPSVAPS
jgi:hypothetical protein